MSLMETVLQEVGEHLESADRLVPVYARDYVAWLEGSVARSLLRPPVGLHPQIAGLVREVARQAPVEARAVPRV